MLVGRAAEPSGEARHRRGIAPPEARRRRAAPPHRVPHLKRQPPKEGDCLSIEALPGCRGL